MANKKFLFVIMFLLVATFRGFAAHAADFYGATVIDREVPTSAWRVGITGFRPIVGNVPVHSPAMKYGLRRGDVILSVNGKDVRNTVELNQFTTDSLAVYVFDGMEKKILKIDRLAIEKEKAERIAAEQKPSLPQPRIVPVERPDNSPPIEFNDEILFKRSINSTSDGEKESSGKGSKTPSGSSQNSKAKAKGD